MATERPRRQVREALSRRERKAFPPEGLRPGRHARASTPRRRPRSTSRGASTRLADLQDKLYAQDRWAVLLVFQAMDAAGKDGAIKHVMSGVNPQGCQVFSFKAPTSEDLDHDYLWRTAKCLPERGRIGIFNRSLLRGGARRPRAPGDPRASRSCRPTLRDEGHLEGAPRGHRRPRALPRSQRRRGREVLPARLEGGAEAALPRAARPAREELEVLVRRREGAPPLEGLHAGVRGDDPGDRGTARALVRRARRQEVVLAHRRRRARSSRRWRGSASRYPKVDERRRRSWRSRARSSGTRRGSPRRRRPPERPRPPQSQEPSARRRSRAQEEERTETACREAALAEQRAPSRRRRARRATSPPRRPIRPPRTTSGTTPRPSRGPVAGRRSRRPRGTGTGGVVRVYSARQREDVMRTAAAMLAMVLAGPARASLAEPPATSPPATPPPTAPSPAPAPTPAPDPRPAGFTLPRLSPLGLRGERSGHRAGGFLRPERGSEVSPR